jgi:hypothetical protein
VLGQKIGVAAVDAVTAMPGVGGIGKIAKVAPKGDLSVEIATQVSDGGVAEIGRIDTLRKQHEGVEKVQILRVVVESDHRLHLAPTNAEPRLEPVIGVRPVQRRMPLSQVTEVAIVNLCADM